MTNKTTQQVLLERSHTHGDFAANAHFSQRLKSLVRQGPSYARLSEVQREALDAICGKLARAISGSTLEIDHWVDIAGYAELVAQSLQECPKIDATPDVEDLRAEDILEVTTAAKMAQRFAPSVKATHKAQRRLDTGPYEPLVEDQRSPQYSLPPTVGNPRPLKGPALSESFWETKKKALNR